jgi:hypothetical protein
MRYTHSTNLSIVALHDTTSSKNREELEKKYMQNQEKERAMTM